MKSLFISFWKPIYTLCIYDQDWWVTVLWISIIEADRVLKSGTTLLLAQTTWESWLLHLLPVPSFLASLYTVVILIDWHPGILLWLKHTFSRLNDLSNFQSIFFSNFILLLKTILTYWEIIDNNPHWNVKCDGLIYLCFVEWISWKLNYSIYLY